MKINNKGYAITLIVFGILIVFIVVLSTLLITMNNSTKINKTVKESVVESIQLGEDTSGASFIDRLEAIETKLAKISSDSNVIDTIYPVGSIYMSAEDDTIEKVQARFGGKWEKYAQGRTIIGEGTTTDENGNALSYSKNQTGGSSFVTLTSENIPSHTHSIPALSGTAASAGAHTHTLTAKGSVSSSFSGSAVTSGSTGSGYSIGYGSSTRTTSSAGAHTHNQSFYQSSKEASGYSLATSAGFLNRAMVTATSGNHGNIASAGAHTHTVSDYYANSISGVAAHTHSVTAKGSVSSTFTGSSATSSSNGAHTHNVTTTANNTGSVGSSKSFNVQNPYITVYMYKRVE